jgi:3-phosphoshikimate 1-carboxyvinyltransferase
MDGDRRGGRDQSRVADVIWLAIPPSRGISRRILAPPSKSHTNRALILAAAASREMLVRGPLECDDTDAMRGALEAAGARFRHDSAGLRVLPGPPPAGAIEMDVRESGTACRFLAAFAAVCPGAEVRLGGAPRLCERPVGPLVDALRALGADIRYLGREGHPPLAIRGRELEGGRLEVDSRDSSQFASALLLAAPRMRRGLELRVPAPSVSRAYLEVTCEILGAAGVAARADASGIRVEPGPASAAEIAVPGDASSAFALAGAVAASGGEIRIGNFPWPSAQADARAFASLEAMGVEVDAGEGELRVAGRARRPVAADAEDFPDAVPVLAAVAARVEGDSRISGIAHLRLKESDRIGALVDLIRAAGAQAQEEPAAIRIRGPAASGEAPTFPTRSDHRIVMAAAVLALERGGFVESPASVSKSYPGFFRDLFG